VLSVKVPPVRAQPALLLGRARYPVPPQSLTRGGTCWPKYNPSWFYLSTGRYLLSVKGILPFLGTCKLEAGGFPATRPRAQHPRTHVLARAE